MNYSIVGMYMSAQISYNRFVYVCSAWKGHLLDPYTIILTKGT